MTYQDIASIGNRIRENVSKVIVGKENQIDLILTAIIAKGHILLDDVPGTGKTVLARSLAKSLNCGFSRIQFTPDLLPTDITGMSIYQPNSGEFVFSPGPVFTNVLLADEINRATPRTQSALLECMEEKQVTESGVTRKLDEPFLVIATQNPVETQGTFPLPEAQLDRFMMKLSMGYPTEAEAIQIMQRFIQASPLDELTSVAEKDDIRQAQKLFSSCAVLEPIMKYISDLCAATRVHEQVLMGVSPRSMLALLRASQAYAALHGRDFVTPDDVKSLAIPVLSHRLILRGLYNSSKETDKVITEILDRVPVPTEAVK